MFALQQSTQTQHCRPAPSIDGTGHRRFALYTSTLSACSIIRAGESGLPAEGDDARGRPKLRGLEDGNEPPLLLPELSPWKGPPYIIYGVRVMSKRAKAGERQGGLLVKRSR
jgi:hypothetical protein